MDRRTYFTHGLGLMAFKYAVDAALIGGVAGRFWTPLDYLNPLWSARAELVRAAPWLGPALVIIALPFLWIGVSMTMRRAVHAGRSPWLALLFFVPVLNYLLMLALSLAPPPPASKVAWPVAEPPPQVDGRLQSAMLGVAASIGITLVTVAVGIYLRRSYSTGLFLGVPFTIGYISSYIYNHRFPRSVGASIVIASVSVAIAAGALVVFALEGVVCIAMAAPIALVVAWPGAVLGRIVAQRSIESRWGGGAGFAVLIAPLVVALEPRPAPPPHEVVSVLEIDAPPAAVWRHVVAFSDLPPATEWYFRAGVAAPTRARIDGAGVGATRYCDFTTGSFVEPITAWDEGRLLAFDITAQAPPMREWSPYRQVNPPPPHLDGYFRATHGEFRLTPLPGGRTRLEGRTAYVVAMFPQRYWTLPAGGIVGAIHGRVLRHIKALAEEEHR